MSRDSTEDGMHTPGSDAHHAAHQHAMAVHHAAHQRAMDTHRAAHRHALDLQDAQRVAMEGRRREHRRWEHRRWEHRRQHAYYGAPALRASSGRGAVSGLIRFVVNLAVLALVIGGVLLVLRPTDPVWLAHLVDQLDVLVRTLRDVVS